MNRSYSKIRHMQKSNMILESRRLGKNILLEYDIDDENMTSIDQELSSISQDISELTPDLDFSTAETAQTSLDNTDVCQIGDDVNGYVERKFGEKIKEMFPDKFREIIKVVAEHINKFIDFLSSLRLSELKTLLKDFKNKIRSKSNLVSEEILKEFFGTSMALVTIGTFSMPALVLTIASVVLVTLIGLWLLKSLLCAFNINITTKKRCRVRSFSWGQCK